MKAVAVRFEGTLCPSAAFEDLEVGPPDEDVIAQIALLREAGHYVYVLSAFASTTMGLKILQDWVITHGVGADEVWASWGLPDCVIVDRTAVADADGVLDESATESVSK